MSDGMMIILIFGLIIIIPIIVVFSVLFASKSIRERKKKTYTGHVKGTVLKIGGGGLERPYIIYVEYTVDGVSYRIKETAKVKTEAIKIGKIPIGQKKKFVIGQISKGDTVDVQYDERNPKKAIISGNDGLATN